MIGRLGLVGCGLIGGSFALALKRGGLVHRVVGCSESGLATDEALRLGIIDEAASTPGEAAIGADLVLVAVPVSATEDVLRALRDAIAPGTWVMDVGSTKRDVVDAARRALRERAGSFVAAHPIAGKEAAGAVHAEATLFVGRRVILTPTPQTSPELLQRASEVWTAVGAVVEQMTPEDHDAAFAAVSHLPHLLAFAYLNAIVGQPAGADFLALAGPGFRDFTRIAAGDPALWRDVFAANREELLKQSMRFRQALEALEHVIRSEDAESLEGLIRSASSARSNWQITAVKRPRGD